MKKLTTLSIVSLAALISAPTMAEIKFSGFGSIVAGQTLEDDETLTADFYDVGQYDNTTTFKAESVLGLQVSADIAPNLKATGQLLAKGTDEFQPELDWYYLTYKAGDDWTLMAGRRNIPMYYYSEFSEVGYAYPWIRPPSNLYWWQVTQFNGFHATYDFSTDDYTNTVTAFYGNEYSTDNKEMLYYAEIGNRTLNGAAITQVNEQWTDIAGFNVNIIGESFDLRMVYFQNDRKRIDTNINGETAVRASASGFSQQFFGIGGNVNISDFTIIYDANYVAYDDDVGTVFPTYLISAVYNIDQYQPYVTYSKADHWQTKSDNEEDYEEHYMASIGLRYNLSSKASAKLQFDHFEDEGDKATGWDYHGNSQTVSAAVDFIF
jgi:hypothetical protein